MKRAGRMITCGLLTVLSAVQVQSQVTVPTTQPSIDIEVRKATTGAAPAQGEQSSAKLEFELTARFKMQDEYGVRQAIDSLYHVARAAGQEKEVLACLRSDPTTPISNLLPVLQGLADAKFAKWRLIAGERQVTLTLPDLSQGGSDLPVRGDNRRRVVRLTVRPSPTAGKVGLFEIEELGKTEDPVALTGALRAVSKAFGKDLPMVAINAGEKATFAMVVETFAAATEAGFGKVALSRKLVDHEPDAKLTKLPEKDFVVPAGWLTIKPEPGGTSEGWPGERK